MHIWVEYVDISYDTSSEMKQIWASNPVNIISCAGISNCISLRTTENTSLARAIGFNRPAVKRFYDNLSDVFNWKSYTPDSIYNMDETGVTTVPSQNRVTVLAKKGTRSVGRIVSAERGTLVTIVCAINAVGTTFCAGLLLGQLALQMVLVG